MEEFEQADKLVEDDLLDEEEQTPAASPAEQTVDQTKAFAKRLKEETEKVRNNEREEIAKQFGYNSWQEYVDAQTNNKLLDNGLDPEAVRPMLQDLIKNDPQYIEAMKFKAEKEELEKELFASNSLQDLNNKFGLSYKSINELDSDTIDMWNKGIPLEKAYAANNWEKIQQMAVKQAASKDNGKSHMKTVTGSNMQTTYKEPTKDELSVFRAFGISEEQAKEYINRTNK